MGVRDGRSRCSGKEFDAEVYPAKVQVDGRCYGLRTEWALVMKLVKDTMLMEGNGRPIERRL